MQDRVSVTIDGRRYVLVTEESEDYLRVIADYVTEKIQEQKQTFLVSETDAAVMSALIICDELYKSRLAATNALNEIQSCLEDARKARAEVTELKREIKRLRQMLR